MKSFNDKEKEVTEVELDNVVEYKDFKAGLIKVVLNKCLGDFMFSPDDLDEIRIKLQSELDANLVFSTQVILDDKIRNGTLSGKVNFTNAKGIPCDVVFEVIATGAKFDDF